MTPRDRQNGFTLIEVLIGATLLAVMMALLATALFTMTRSARAGEARLEQLDSTELVHAFLARELGGAIPLTERVDGDEHALFEGRTDRLRFVGHLPAAQAGGLQFMELAIAPQTGKDALVLRYTDAWPETRFGPPDAAWQTRTLLPNMHRLHYAYYGNPKDDAPAEWHSDWLDHDRLPQLIRVELEPTAGAAASIVAEVRVRTAVAQAALFRDPPGRGR
jgi:general secretion pathway protein J